MHQPRAFVGLRFANPTCAADGTTRRSLADPDDQMDQCRCMEYRRAAVAGGTFFFTVVTDNRRPILASADAVEVLRAAFRRVRQQRPFRVNAAVILPDHLHCVWTLPPGDSDFATRWRLIKTGFTKHCDPALRVAPNAARCAKTEQALWQQRYWEHLIRDETDLRRHVEYIHFNPVKHGLAQLPIEWPFSSFRRHVADGRYPRDWGSEPMGFAGAGHE